MPPQELSAPDSTASALQGQTAAALEPQNGLGWLPSTVHVVQTAEPLSVNKAEQPSPVKAELPVAAAVEQPAACNGAVDVLKEGPHVPQDPAPSQLAEVRPSATGKELEMPVQGSKCFGHPARKTLTQSRWLARWGRCWLPVSPCAQSAAAQHIRLAGPGCMLPCGSLLREVMLSRRGLQSCLCPASPLLLSRHSHMANLHAGVG